MAPRKQPNSLFKICLRYTLNLINDSCFKIERSYPETAYQECKRQVLQMKAHLENMLPVRLFDALCLERGVVRYRGDPRVQLHVLFQSGITVFRKCDIDTSISEFFWTKSLPMFERLVILDLKFLCTDEILEAISSTCTRLEELNIVSKVNIHKSRINASVLIRYVSDAGLKHVANFKQLRILSMDPPRNERAQRVGRCITQSGIIFLVGELPYLEELRIESCDIGSTLINTNTKLGPLGLRKINCHFASPEGIKKLIKICPDLKELSVTDLSAHDKDAIMDQIAQSDLRLNRLDMSFFSFTESMLQLLYAKGEYLTHFSFWEMDHTIDIHALISIGKYCPNLQTLYLITQSVALAIPPFFKRPTDIFRNLESLTLGNEYYDIDSIVIFFFQCSQKIKRLEVKFQSKIVFDTTLLFLLNKGLLNDIIYVWLDCTVDVAKNTVLQMIQKCDHLKMFTYFSEDSSDLHKYIVDNNLDIRLGSY